MDNHSSLYIIVAIDVMKIEENAFLLLFSIYYERYNGMQYKNVKRSLYMEGAHLLYRNLKITGPPPAQTGVSFFFKGTLKKQNRLTFEFNKTPHSNQAA